MKASLQLQIGQSLTMTPQLQQAIKLLRMSTLDLQQEIQETLDSNPLLETEELSDNRDAEVPDDKASESSDTLASSSADDLDFEQSSDLPDDLGVDTRWDDIFISNNTSSSGSVDTDLIDQRNSITETLFDHLEWQLSLTSLSDRDKAIGLVIIDEISNEGFLQAELGELVGACEQMLNISETAKLDDPDCGVEIDEIEAVLHSIQNFDPFGIGARDLQECMQIQVRQLDNGSAAFEAVSLLINEHIDALASSDLKGLIKLTKLSELEVSTALEIIRQLDPRPGLQIAEVETDYIVPDVIVRKVKDDWEIELSNDSLPKLRVNEEYASLIKRADNSSENQFLKDHLQEAKWFIKSLQSRNETLMKVAATIVDYQQGFLEYGDEAMKPMVLHDVAEAVDMHESTISRVTTQKYMLTPHGIFELKYFFSSHVSTSVGGECSSTAIRALIKKLVSAENPKKPLSDAKMAALLKEQGIEVARRTVAKYRESLNIASSSERKRLL